MQKRLYVQISPKQIIISLLKRSKSRFILIKPKTSKLHLLEIQKKQIFNISNIFLYIKKYLQENNIKEAKVIISSPKINSYYLKTPKKFDLQESLNLFLLQLILCCSKANLLIEKIISKSILQNGNNMTFFSKNNLDNQLDFFKQFKPQRKNNPFVWLTSTSLILILIILTQFKLQKIEETKLETTKQKIESIKKQNGILQNKLHKMHTLQSKNEKLKKQFEKILKTQNKQNNPKEILLSISKAIPDNCWLENIKIFKKPETKRKAILLTGNAPEDKDILNFISEISKSPKFKNLKIDSIKSEKVLENNRFLDVNHPKIYSFRITGNLTP